MLNMNAQEARVRANSWRCASVCCLASAFVSALCLGSKPQILKYLAASAGSSYEASLVWALLILMVWLGAGFWASSVAAALRLQAENTKHQERPPL